MYIPKEFKETNQAEILHFIGKNALGILVSSTGVFEPLVSHIPFISSLENDEIILEGHLSIHNPHADQIKKGKTALVIFQGPNAYVSSSVYSHENVPTWNYQAVHIYGTVEILSNDALQAHLAQAVDFFESARDPKLAYSNFSKSMLESYLNEIIGFRLRAYKTEAAYKMSQNRNNTDFQNIVTDLSESNNPSDQEVAKEMANLKKSQKQ
jgi:transcriptional regulator